MLLRAIFMYSNINGVFHGGDDVCFCWQQTVQLLNAYVICMRSVLVPQKHVRCSSFDDDYVALITVVRNVMHVFYECAMQRKLFSGQLRNMYETGKSRKLIVLKNYYRLLGVTFKNYDITDRSCCRRCQLVQTTTGLRTPTSITLEIRHILPSP